MGTHTVARQLKDIIIKWRSDPPPAQYLLDRWEDEYFAGRQKADPEQVHKTRQRLMAYEEWGNRMANRALREALIAVAQKAKDGTLKPDSQVQIKYLADGVAMVTRDTSAAYGTPKPTPTQIGKLIINAGERPQPRKLKAPKVKVEDVIEGEVRELSVGNGD